MKDRKEMTASQENKVGIIFYRYAQSALRTSSPRLIGGMMELIFDTSERGVDIVS